MSNTIQSPRGTQDILPQARVMWETVETAATQIAQQYGFGRIEVPTFERTELFCRSVGDTTDVVQKEMFTFEDRGGRSLTLRPEGTAGVLRAAMQNGLLDGALPLKLFYLMTCFRNERPQAGRFKEFHQFGVELFGAASPRADAEVISLADTFLRRLGIKKAKLQINSIGCPTCRAAYHQALKKYFDAHEAQLCALCQERLEKNAMRILDCKNEACQQSAKGAPRMKDYLCDECAQHFLQVQNCLTRLGIPFELEDTMVRGLDYYSKTVFEFVSSDLGAKSALCGGGRYDTLVQSMGGKPTAALGFAIGLERIILVMQKQGIPPNPPARCSIYFAAQGEAAAQQAMALALELRALGCYAEFDTAMRSLKAQMKYANKIGAQYSCVLGETELADGKVSLKEMGSGQEREVELTKLVKEVSRLWQ